MIARLLVIGAGPKAAAIGAKAAALRSAGVVNVPKVLVIDAIGWAANWDGGAGFTDGDQPLGTAPEKDVGFPYNSLWGERTDREMFAYSWHAYLIAQGRYGKWVDEGKPHPDHARWASYVRWVAKTCNIEMIRGKVRRITVEGAQWKLSYDGSSQAVEGDALVITGPGEATKLHGQPKSHRIFDGQDFWQRLHEVDKFRFDETVGVVGSGETAGAIVAEILRRTRGKMIAVAIINRSGALFSRGESYHESRLFSEASSWWRSCSEDDRKNFIARTDRGVISPHYMAKIGAAQPMKLDVARIAENDDEIELYDKVENPCARFSYLVNATGFNAAGLLRGALSSELQQRLPRDLEVAIDENLAVSNFTPTLHLPMLAALSQGPGFPNLSCLGLLSDRILARHVAIK